MRPILVITALTSEALPLVERWELKPVRNEPLLERFQTYGGDHRYVAISGIGKLKSATATAALTTALAGQYLPSLVNLGIAGAPATHGAQGELFIVNKVRDVATNTRFYPDILVRHSIRESAVDTYDHAVSTPPSQNVLVDMEGAGFMQAATSLTAPSSTLVIKVVSDTCTGERITPSSASALIATHIESIDKTINAWQGALKPPAALDTDEAALIEQLIASARLSQSQRTEAVRSLISFKMRGGVISRVVLPLLARDGSSKHARQKLFEELITHTHETDPL